MWEVLGKYRVVLFFLKLECQRCRHSFKKDKKKSRVHKDSEERRGRGGVVVVGVLVFYDTHL
jgi:hypothetical protein